MHLSLQRTSLPAIIVATALLPAATALAEPPIGWRTDGTGKYPKAEPPLEWSTTKNVVWSTAMPGYGVSSPVLLADRIFVCSEPATLLCLSEKDGKILWKKTSSYSDLDLDADVREQLKTELEQTAELNKKQSAIQKERDAVHQDLIKEKAAKEEIEAKLKPFNTQINDLTNEKQKLKLAVLYTQPGTHPTAGYSAPTPVTDGKHVWVAYGNGLVAGYDLEGELQWLKLVEHSNAGYAHSGSPILAGDKLLIHFTDLVALDPKSGDELWRLKLPTAHGTPLATRIGDTDVVLTPKGALVRVKDGKLLADNLGSCGSNSPILEDGTAYYVHGTAIAAPLPKSLDEPFKPKPRWKQKVEGEGYWYSSPVVQDGLFYVCSDQGTLTVLDAAKGELIYEQRLDMRGATYPSISLAGGRIYVSSDNGTTVVVEPGREYKELARNKLEPFRSSLVFEGKRLYVRTEKNLYCIGD